MTTKKMEKGQGISRRDFIKVSSTASLAAMVSGTGVLFATGSDRIRVGLIGCGGRGTGAAIDCVNSSPNIVITAMGDLFKDRLDRSLGRLTEKLKKENLLVSKDTCFAGFDAFKKVLACDIDMVILAAPVLAALGAFAALVTECTLEVEKEEES